MNVFLFRFWRRRRESGIRGTGGGKGSHNDGAFDNSFLIELIQNTVLKIKSPRYGIHVLYSIAAMAMNLFEIHLTDGRTSRASVRRQ